MLDMWAPLSAVGGTDAVQSPPSEQNSDQENHTVIS